RFLLGHSLGGQLGMLYLSRHPEMADGAILVGAPSCYYKGWRFPKDLVMLLAIHLAIPIASHVGFFPGSRLGILGDESTQVMRDLARQVRTGEYRPAASPEDFEQLLRELRIPVLAITISGDDLAPERGIDHLCGKLRRADITRWTYCPEGAGVGLQR